MSKTERISKHTHMARLDDGRCLFLSNVPNDNIVSSIVWNAGGRNWETMPQTVGNVRIVPFGWNNDLPTFIRDIVGDNNLVPGILNRQLGLLWGQGPQLYKLGFADDRIVKMWQEDKDVMAWLESWDYKSYLRGAIIDYLNLGGFFDAKYLERGHRIGLRPKIAMLEHISAKNARLEWPENGSNSIADVKHIVVGDFEQNCINTGVRLYPVYDRRNPGLYPVSASYNNLESFARDFYSVPQFWGALRWILRGSEIPVIFKYVTDNGINLAYHVHSNDLYWEKKREDIIKAHPDWDDAKIDKELANVTKGILDSMVAVLTGKQNAGKLFHSIDVVDDTGQIHKWEIEPIDQKIKDFVDSQLKIGEASTSAITSGMGLHPSLSNIMVNGKLASGSEMLYAFKLYLHSDTDIPSDIILESINQAIAFNFPEKDLRLGFYHSSVQTEESLSAPDRLKNS